MNSNFKKKPLMMGMIILTLLTSFNAYSNKALQESFQGKISKDIFSNNSYQCEDQPSKKSSRITLAFKNSEFNFSHLDKKRNISILWFGTYQLQGPGKLLLKTKEYRMKDIYGLRIKKDFELLFEVLGNASLFHLRSKQANYRCQRSRY